jgi:type IV secretory pathway TrbD component
MRVSPIYQSLHRPKLIYGVPRNRASFTTLGAVLGVLAGWQVAGSVLVCIVSVGLAMLLFAWWRYQYEGDPMREAIAREYVKQADFYDPMLFVNRKQPRGRPEGFAKDRHV